MNTYYIRLVQCFDDAVWGKQAMPWIASPLIRVHRNRLKNAVFEWVATGRPMNIDEWRGKAVVMYEQDHYKPSMSPWIYAKTMPLP